MMPAVPFRSVLRLLNQRLTNSFVFPLLNAMETTIRRTFSTKISQRRQNKAASRGITIVQSVV